MSLSLYLFLSTNSVWKIDKAKYVGETSVWYLHVAGSENNAIARNLLVLLQVDDVAHLLKIIEKN